MTASIHLKGLLAGLMALAIAGAALAQSTPPNPAAKDPAVGAGQQSSQTTPMGQTGTPPPSGSTAAGTSGSTSGSTMGASGSPAASADTGTTASSRTAKADRN
jgi:hypothetical protein